MRSRSGTSLGAGERTAPGGALLEDRRRVLALHRRRALACSGEAQCVHLPAVRRSGSPGCLAAPTLGGDGAPSARRAGDLSSRVRCSVIATSSRRVLLEVAAEA